MAYENFATEENLGRIIEFMKVCMAYRRTLRAGTGGATLRPPAPVLLGTFTYGGRTIRISTTYDGHTSPDTGSIGILPTLNSSENVTPGLLVATHKTQVRLPPESAVTPAPAKQATQPDSDTPKRKRTTKSKKDATSDELWRAKAQEFMRALQLWLVRNELWMRWGRSIDNTGNTRANDQLGSEISDAVRTFGKARVTAAFTAFCKENKLATLVLNDLSEENALKAIRFLDQWAAKVKYATRFNRPAEESRPLTRTELVAEEMFDADMTELDAPGERVVEDPDGLSLIAADDFEIASSAPLNIGDANDLAEKLTEWFDGIRKAVKAEKVVAIETFKAYPYTFTVVFSPEMSLSIIARVVTREWKLIESKTVSVPAQAFREFDSGKQKSIVSAGLATQFAAAGQSTGLFVADGDTRYHGVFGLWSYVIPQLQTILRARVAQATEAMRARTAQGERIKLLDMKDDIELGDLPRASSFDRLRLATLLFGSRDAYDDAVRHAFSTLLDRADRLPGRAVGMPIGQTYFGASIEVEVTREEHTVKRGRKLYPVYVVSIAFLLRGSESDRSSGYRTVVQGRWVLSSPRFATEREWGYKEQSLTLPVGGGGFTKYMARDMTTSYDLNALFLHLRSRLMDYFLYAVQGWVQALKVTRREPTQQEVLDSTLGKVLRDDQIIAEERVAEEARRAEVVRQRTAELQKFREDVARMDLNITEARALMFARHVIDAVVNNKRITDPTSLYRDQYDLSISFGDFRLGLGVLLTRGAVDMRRYPLELMGFDPRRRMASGEFASAAGSRIDFEVDLQFILRRADKLEANDPATTEEAQARLIASFVTAGQALASRYRDWVMTQVRDYEASLAMRQAEEDAHTRRVQQIELDGLRLGRRMRK